MLLTLNQEGLLVHAGSDDPWVTDRLPAFCANPVDASGAGDCLMITTALALCSGSTVWQAAYTGSVAASSSKSLGQSANCPSGTPCGCGIEPMKAILLAGGIGSRLRPITATIPKCLVPIHGQPLLDIWLEQLTAHDIGPFLVNTHYLPKQVEDFVEQSLYRSPLLWPMRLSC